MWEVSTGTPLVVTDTFEVGWSVDFSPDGRRVYTGGDDAMLRTWDLYGDQQFLPPDVRTARRDRTSSTSRRRPTAGGWPTLVRPASGSVRFLDTVTGKWTHVESPR